MESLEPISCDFNKLETNDMIQQDKPIPLNDILKNAQYMKLQSINDQNEVINDDIQSSKCAKGQLNVNNKLYIPPTFARKTFHAPKVISLSLSIQTGKPPRYIDELEYGIKDTIKYQSLFPRSVNYDKICPAKSPYISPLLIALLSELNDHIPPLKCIVNGSNKKDIEKCDILFNTLLKFKNNQQINPNAYNIFFRDVPPHILTNTLLIFFQRTKFPLFLPTKELCDVVLSNQYRLEYAPFGCIDLDKEDPLMTALMNALSLSSNYQIANLAYFIECCQRWVRSDIFYELKKKPRSSLNNLYEEAIATIAVLFGPSIVGMPRNYVALKIINQSLPLLSDLRNTILYFLLGIPPLEFWHIWSIHSICLQDDEFRSWKHPDPFLKPKGSDKLYETLPFI